MPAGADDAPSVRSATPGAAKQSCFMAWFSGRAHPDDRRDPETLAGGAARPAPCLSRRGEVSDDEERRVARDWVLGVGLPADGARAWRARPRRVGADAAGGGGG